MAMIMIVILYGLGLAFFGQSLIYNVLLNNQINRAFWGTTPLTDSVIAYQKFVYGVLGTVVGGWGVILLFITHYPFRRKEKWAWIGLTLSLTFWFFTDTPISLYYGAYSNALMNTLMIVALGLPLYCTRKEFTKLG